MRKRISRWTSRAAAVLVVLAGTGDLAVAYERPVHRRLSEVAFLRVMSDPALQARLGISTRQLFGSQLGDPPAAIDWVMEGSHDEDDFPRSLNHFYDPTTNRGLPPLGAPAPIWGLFRGPNDFSLPHARDWLHSALVDPSASERERAWDQFFYSLGHVIHLVQDMAQPEHVRNDTHFHLGDPSEAEQFFTDFSRYERYNLGQIGNLVFDGYPTVRLPSYLDYFDDENGRGLAEFANSQFVSQDTNLDSGQYGSPSEGGSAFDITEDETISVWVRLPGRGMEQQERTVKVLYRRYTYRDSYRPADGDNPRLSAFSFFDFIDRSLNSSRAYTLTESTFDTQANILLPRAVGYSAGLIEHLFRGRLEISLPDAGVYSAIDQQRSDGETARFEELRVKLRNVTPPIQVPGQAPLPEEMTDGTVQAIVTYHPNGCYDDDLGGELDPLGTIPNGCSFSVYRGPSTRATSLEMPVASIPRNTPVEVSFDFSADPIPISARDISVRLVYRGRLGATEPDAIVVETKDLSEPTFVGYVNSTDLYVIDGTFYDTDDIIADPALWGLVHPDRDTAIAIVQP